LRVQHALTLLSILLSCVHEAQHGACTNLTLKVFRAATLLQVIELDHDFGDTFSGVLTTSEGHMTALYANYNEQSGTGDIEEYCRGIPIAVIKPWLNQVTPHSVSRCSMKFHVCADVSCHKVP
jgi:hypothetical protein